MMDHHHHHTDAHHIHHDHHHHHHSDHHHESDHHHHHDSHHDSHHEHHHHDHHGHHHHGHHHKRAAPELIKPVEHEELPPPFDVKALSCPKFNGSFQVKSHCGYFIICVEGKVSGPFSCPKGMSFDETKETCTSERAGC